MNIGSAKQLYIDGSLIASSHGIAITMNSPRKTNERCIAA